MRKFSLSFITLSVGLGLLPLAQAENTLRSSICWNKCVLARPAVVRTWCVSHSIGWN